MDRLPGCDNATRDTNGFGVALLIDGVRVARLANKMTDDGGKKNTLICQHYRISHSRQIWQNKNSNLIRIRSKSDMKKSLFPSLIFTLILFYFAVRYIFFTNLTLRFSILQIEKKGKD